MSLDITTFEEIPGAWDDFGMDWGDPDPMRSAYWAALVSAYCERFGYGYFNTPSIGFEAGGFLSADAIADFQRRVHDLVGEFVDAEATYGYEEGKVATFKRLTYAALVGRDPECDLMLHDVHPGMPVGNVKDFMKACKKVFSHLKWKGIGFKLALRSDVKTASWDETPDSGSYQNTNPNKSYGAAVADAVARIELPEGLYRWVGVDFGAAYGNYSFPRVRKMWFWGWGADGYYASGNVTVLSSQEYVVPAFGFDNADVRILVTTAEVPPDVPGGNGQHPPDVLNYPHPESQFPPGSVTVKTVAGAEPGKPIPMDTFHPGTVPPLPTNPPEPDWHTNWRDGIFHCRKSVDCCADFSGVYRFP